MNKCPKCGTPQVENLPFCESCGNVFPKKKPKLSKASLTGFILSLLSVAGFILTLYFFKRIWYDDDYNPAFTALIITSLIITVAGFLSGLIVSIIGVKKSRKPDMKGLGYSIAGISISSVMGVISLTVGVIILLGYGLISLLISGINSYYDSNYFQGETKTFDDMLIRLNKNEDEAAVFEWYWDGDPENLVIEIPDQGPDGVKITSLGGRTGSSVPLGFEIKLADGLEDYFETSAYKQSPGYSYTWNIFTDLSKLGIEPGTTVYYKEIEFTVKFGNNIKDIDFRNDPYFLAIVNDDGSISLYRYYYKFECDDNDTFYVNDGGQLIKERPGTEVFSQGTYTGIDKVIIVEET